jgi:ribose-phosphate pyrophosphokinase
VTADKERDLTNGEIVRTVVDIPSHIPDSAIYLVVDDICDGGRTFVELAKAIPEEKRSHLHLLVTHGIFSQGLDVLRQYYSEISCINLMNKSIGQLGAPLNSTIKL